ncbi:MAG: hypothetical protein ACYSX0_13985 [Planctomycetota bacterium]|jgi:hypothetical protein
MAILTRLSWFILAAALLLFSGGPALAQDDEEETVVEEGSDAETPGEEEGEKPAAEVKKENWQPAPKRVPGEKHPKVSCEEKTKTYRLMLPDDWVIKERYMKDTVAAFDLLLPGTEKGAQLWLTKRDNLGDPRGALYNFHAGTAKNLDARKAEAVQKPLPHSVFWYTGNEGDLVRTTAFVRIKGHSFYLTLKCTDEDYGPVTRTDFLAAAASLETTLERRPTIPKTYKIKKKGRFLFAIHPKAKTSISAAQKILKAAEKRFTKVHGSLPKPKRGEENVIFVHRDREDARSCHEPAADGPSNFYADLYDGRLFIAPVKKEQLEEPGLLAGAAHKLFFILKYGGTRPFWVYNGEQSVGRAEESTGDKLPYLNEGMVDWRKQMTLGKLDRLESIRESQGDSYWRQSFFYVAFFRAGPTKYKKAYQAFLKEFAQTFDGEAALKRHIYSLDQDKLLKAAKEFTEYTLIPLRPKG